MILLVGAGAVGTILAAHIAAGRREPLRIYARAKDLPGMSAAPALRVDTVSAAQPLLVADKPQLTDSLDLAGVDYLFICVKYSGLQKLLDELPVIPPSCTLVSTLNGIAPLRLIRQRLPQARVLPMTIMYNGQLLGPLHAQITTKPIVVASGDDARLLGCFGGSGMKVQRASGDAAVWGKLLINLANAIGAITHTTFKDLFTHPDLRAVYVTVLDEAVGLLERAGIPYKLPMPIPYPVYRWMLLNGGPVPWWIAKIKNGLREGSYASMVADVDQGRQTEVAQLNGEVARLGTEKNIPTPVSDRIVELVEKMAGKAPPSYLSPGELEQQLSLAKA